jgi:hypothetical protein
MTPNLLVMWVVFPKRMYALLILHLVHGLHLLHWLRPLYPFTGFYAFFTCMKFFNSRDLNIKDAPFFNNIT